MKQFKTINQNKVDMEIGYKKQALIDIIKSDEELGLYEQTKCYCGHTTTCDCGPKQETLEEVAERKFQNIGDRLIFEDGAKWQEERSYSEEEVIELLQKALTHKDDGEIGSLVTAQREIRTANFFSWFEQFKKK